MREALKRHVPRSILIRRHRRFQQRAVERMGMVERGERYMAEHGRTVDAGPFSGMVLPPDAVHWEQMAVIPVLRGSYEREITEFMRAWACQHPHGSFVDIGCAEGVYLTAMRRLDCRATGFEIDPVRQRRARELAASNNVTVDVRGEFRPEHADLDDALVLVDIEGAERELIPRYADRFVSCCLIVEFHNGSETAVIPALEPTHDVAVVPFEGRKAFETELRPDDQSWGLFLPRRVQVHSSR